MFEIFRAGRHTDNRGVVRHITEADVAAAAAAYRPALHEAPLTIGHPADNKPAYGWVTALQSRDGILLADFGELDDGFAAQVRAGRYKKVSASFYPPDHPDNPVPGHWYLRHVAFLGAQPPAVKGLKPINFAEDDGCVSFSEAAAFGYTTSIFRSLREWLIGKFGTDEADKVVPNWQIDAIAETAVQEAAEDASESEAGDAGFAEPILEPSPQETPAMSNTIPSAAEAAAIARAEAAEAELAQLKAAQEAARRTQSHEANADFAEGLSRQGTLKPSHKALLVQVLDELEHPSDGVAEFCEGAKKQPLAAALRDWLAALPQAVDFAEIATAERAAPAVAPVEFAESADPAALSHHQRALALAAKEGISYEAAARRTVG